MPSPTTVDADSPIRICVTPSQSAFFAGEPFSVKITFTNTRSPDTPSAKPSPHSHRRGAHSISSAPLARPPTSPGTPRTLAAPLPSATKQKGVPDDAPRRKNLIGTPPQPTAGSSSSSDIPDIIERRRKKQLAPKSLSVSVSPYEAHDAFGVIASASYSQKSFSQATLPHTSSPLARTNTLNLSSKHPHARKHSVLDGQISLDQIFPTTSVPPAPYTPNSSTSSFTLALDPIAEGAQSPYLSTPALGSPTVDTVFLPQQQQQHSVSPTNLSAYPSRNRPTSLGLGQPPKSARNYPRSATELILYSYAQLAGSLVLSQVPESALTNEHIQSLHSIRSALLNRSVLGGGSMDISSTLNSPNPATPRSPRPGQSHNRSSSLSAGLLSILTSSSSSSSPNPNSVTWRSPSGFTPSGTPTSAKFQTGTSSPNILGLGLDVGGDIDPEEPLPTFESQPAMLAVDLSLAPGESRSYTYSIKLPNNLPPTFRGRSLRFSYELVIGTCRATNGVGTGATMGLNSISRVMKVPIRVYNNVSVGNPPRPYDLLWPVSRRRDMGMPGTEAVVEEEINDAHMNVLRVPQLPSLSPVVSSSTLESIKDYARSLLRSLPEKAPVPDEPPRISNGTTHGPAQDRIDDVRWTDMEKEAEGGLAGCREAVEILTRNPKKASYDVNKDGVKVAVLTFPKCAYRLGETILGVVELNERDSRARVLKVSAMLESHECLPSSISPPSSSKHLRRSHGEAHASFTLNTLRTTFALDIPSDASPAFQIRVGTTPPPHNDDNDNGDDGDGDRDDKAASGPPGLSWKIRLCLLVGVASDRSIISGLQGTRLRTLARDGPRGEWGTSWIAISGSAPLEKRDEREARRVRRRLLVQQQQQRLERQMASQKSWSRFLASSFLWRTTIGGGTAGGGGGGEGDEVASEVDTLESAQSNEDLRSSRSSSSRSSSSFEYDGIIPDLAGGVGTGVDYLGGEEGWAEVGLETVECEVPIRVFPGNTAFRALDVVFDV